MYNEKIVVTKTNNNSTTVSKFPKRNKTCRVRNMYQSIQLPNSNNVTLFNDQKQSQFKIHLFILNVNNEILIISCIEIE